MKKLLFMGFILVNNFSGKSQVVNSPAWMNQWFSAWEWLSETKYGLDSVETPIVYFFDDSLFYTNNKKINADIFKGPPINGKDQIWKSGKHHDSILLPNDQVIRAGLMSFAAPFENNKPFFVMSALPIWEKRSAPGKLISAADLATAVFLHEFSHSQQLAGFGKKVEEIEKRFGSDQFPINDDIIQRVFKKDSDYVRSYRMEVDLFYKALFSRSIDEMKVITKQALTLMNKRQDRFKLSSDVPYALMDDIFLSMEGLGQYSAFQWLTEKAQIENSYNNIVNEFRRDGRIWSQDEGLVMFLLFSRLGKPNWKEDMFGSHPKMIRELLQQAVGMHSSK